MKKNPAQLSSADTSILSNFPTQVQVDEVVDVVFSRQVSRSNNEMIVARWQTPYRHFTTYHITEPKNGKQMADWERFKVATDEGQVPPKSITYIKESGSDFYRVLGFNAEVQHDPAS